MVETARDDTRSRPAAERVQRPQARTTERREAVLKAAMNVFGARGYNKGALVEVAEQAGMTHAGVLHHFGSKEGLLVAMLKYRDGEEVAGVPARAQTEGPAFLQCITYRYHGHHVGDIARAYYRPKAEEQEWVTHKDPIALHGQWLMDNGMADRALLDAIQEKLVNEMDAAVDFAVNAPYPDPSRVTEDIYAS